jgi:hypothetical protein
MKPCPLFSVTIICLLGGGCGTVGTGRHSISDPVSEHRNAAHEVERLRESMTDFKPNPAFEDMNKRQLNRALEDLNNATDNRFLRLEKLVVTPPIEPVTMRWSVIRSDKTLAFAANLGPKPVDGVWTKWAVQGGRKLLRFQIVDGLKDGTELAFHPTGEKKSETLYREGKRNGTFVAWGISGKKTQEGRYKNDKRDGLWINYDQGGKESHLITYQNGIEAKE